MVTDLRTPSEPAVEKVPSGWKEMALMAHTSDEDLNVDTFVSFRWHLKLKLPLCFESSTNWIAMRPSIEPT